MTKGRLPDAPLKVNRRMLLALAAGTGASTFARADAPAAEGTRTGRNEVLGEGGLHHAAVRTNDWERTMSFYQKGLGFRMNMAWTEGSGSLNDRLAASARHADGYRWAYLDSGNGIYVEVFEDPTFVPPPAASSEPTKNAGNAIVHMCLRTSRLDAVRQNAHAWGATLSEEPVAFTLNTTTGQGAVHYRICFIQGPNGEWIELLQTHV